MAIKELSKIEAACILELFDLRKKIGISDRSIPKDLDGERVQLLNIIRILKEGSDCECFSEDEQ